ncbi:MAG: XRE family transcriptional regulator [Alphaproteobacteria bacterium]|nr:MAG: XRE family transcriptional regulator [Alphaproteobacteria bacterium]
METRKLEKQIDQLVGGRLRQLRCMNGLTQEAVGRELGVAPQQIQKYEKGENRMSAGKLFLLAEFYKVPMESFFPRQDVEEQLRQTRKLGKIYRMLKRTSQRNIMTMWRRCFGHFRKSAVATSNTYEGRNGQRECAFKTGGTYKTACK